LAVYLSLSILAYCLKSNPTVGRPAELALKALNYPALYIGLYCFPRFLFIAENTAFLTFILALNLPIAALAGAGLGASTCQLRCVFRDRAVASRDSDRASISKRIHFCTLSFNVRDFLLIFLSKGPQNENRGSERNLSG